MEYKINEVPFQMREIAEKLFNMEYLSDITFLVDDKKIYAHSLVLMVRSSVFQKQLEITFGDKKLIPITDWGYDAFYQFIRFIYTDQVNVNNGNTTELLKLAIHYNVIRLVNHMLNGHFSNLQKLDLYKAENCRIDLNRTTIKLQVACAFKYYLNEDKLISKQSDTIEEILSFDAIEKGITESYILDALIRWMNHYCMENQIQLTECCKQFPQLFHAIRFPTMSNDELRIIKTKYPDLLTENDFMKLASHKIYGVTYDDGMWNTSPRAELVWPYELKTYPDESDFKTKFSVSSDMILHGFVIGINKNVESVRRLNITISCQHRDLSKVTEINLNEIELASFFGLISLGKSLRIRPDFIYTIGYTYGSMSKATQYYSREQQSDLIINAPPNTIKIIEAHPTMIEITLFKP